MRRSLLLALSAFAIFSISWFLPVLRDPSATETARVPGWEAAKFAARASYVGHESNVVLNVILRATAWTNVLFLLAFGLALVSGASHRAHWWAAGALGLATALNAQFLIPWDEAMGLSWGFYLWLASFPLLAAASALQARERAHRSPRFSDHGGDGLTCVAADRA